MTKEISYTYDGKLYHLWHGTQYYQYDSYTLIKSKIDQLYEVARQEDEKRA